MGGSYPRMLAEKRGRSFRRVDDCAATKRVSRQGIDLQGGDSWVCPIDARKINKVEETIRQAKLGGNKCERRGNQKERTHPRSAASYSFRQTVLFPVSAISKQSLQITYPNLFS